MLIAFAINPVYGRDNDTIDSRYAMKKRIEKKKKEENVRRFESAISSRTFVYSFVIFVRCNNYNGLDMR